MPSGRRSASRLERAGRGRIRTSSLRSSWTTSVARAWTSVSRPRPSCGSVDEHDVGVGGVAELAAAEAAHADDERCRRRAARPRAASTSRVAASSATWIVAAGEVGQRRADAGQVDGADEVGHDDAEQLVAADRAHRRRPPRRPSRAAPGGRLHRRRERLAACAASGRCRRRGSTTLSGERTSRSAAYRLRARQCASRSAARPSSRSILRYQCVVPSSSETRRKDSSPASGSASSANHPSMTGSRVRWMAARRLTPVGQRLDVPHARRPGRGSRGRAGAVGPPPGVRRASVGAEPGGGREQRAVEEPLVQPPHLAGGGLPVGDDGARRVASGAPWRGRAGAGRPRSPA